MDTSVRVLLVDDEPGIRHVLGALIRDFGYNVHTAESAREALEAFTANPFPIVVTDIRMPGMDGLALLERVRNQNPDTQVVMITGHGDMDNAVECLRLGAADFIAKPVNDDLLEHSLKRAAEQYSLREQIRRYTEHLEELVASRTRELLEAHRVAVVGETVACMAHTIKNLAAALEGSGETCLRAHGVEVVVVNAAVVEEQVLLEAERIESVHDLAFGTTRIVERFVRRLTAGAV